MDCGLQAGVGLRMDGKGAEVSVVEVLRLAVECGLAQRLNVLLLGGSQ